MAQQLEIDPSKEPRLALRHADGPTLPAVFTLVHQAFEYFAETQPTLLAAIHGDRSIMYGELDGRANQLANLLTISGLRPRQRVCLVVKRSIPMLVGILAVLKAGCQYVPCDGGVVTGDMLTHIFRDTKAQFIMCSQEYEGKVRNSAVPGQNVLALESQLDTISSLGLNRAFTDVVPTDGAYVIYTSGLFGVPLYTEESADPRQAQQEHRKELT